jgi:hypothetical protein
MSSKYLLKPVNNITNKNQKNKVEIFIFLMKKSRWLYDKNKYFKKKSRAKHRRPYFARVKTPQLAWGEPIFVISTI